MYWAEALADQAEDLELQAVFSKLAKDLSDNEAVIVNELNEVQGKSMDIGGYYNPNDDLGSKAMRPSTTLNRIIDGFQV